MKVTLVKIIPDILKELDKKNFKKTFKVQSFLAGELY